MKKKILLGLLVVVGLFAITGCSNSNDDENSGKQKSSNKMITCTDKSASGTTWSVELDKNNIMPKLDKLAELEAKASAAKSRLETAKNLQTKNKEAAEEDQRHRGLQKRQGRKEAQQDRKVIQRHRAQSRQDVQLPAEDICKDHEKGQDVL